MFGMGELNSAMRGTLIQPILVLEGLADRLDTGRAWKPGGLGRLVVTLERPSVSPHKVTPKTGVLSYLRGNLDPVRVYASHP